MDPARKRTIRLVVALSAAVALAVALVYTSINASTETTTPSQLLAAVPSSKAYEVTGKVEAGTWTHQGVVHEFRLQDRDGTQSIPVEYRGAVPDPFREGREVVVTVRKEGDVYVGEHDSLITKCPSKFATESPDSAPA